MREKKPEWATATLKIYPTLHRRLRVKAAEKGVTISDLIEEMETWYNKTHKGDTEEKK